MKVPHVLALRLRCAAPVLACAFPSVCVAQARAESAIIEASDVARHVQNFTAPGWMPPAERLATVEAILEDLQVSTDLRD